MNDATAVPKLTPSSSVQRPPAAGDGTAIGVVGVTIATELPSAATSGGPSTTASIAASISSGSVSLDRIACSATYVTTATTMFTNAAVSSVPGSPTAPISQKPATSTPTAAPIELAK